MQDNDGPGGALQLAIIVREALYALPGALDHQVVDRALVGEGWAGENPP